MAEKEQKIELIDADDMIEGSPEWRAKHMPKLHEELKKLSPGWAAVMERVKNGADKKAD